MKYTFLILLGIAALTAGGATLTPAEALLRAQQSLPQSAGGTGSSSPVTLAYTHPSPSGEAAVYAFDRGTRQGWMLVSADNAAAPLLAYSPEGTFPADTASMPPAMRQWLDMYAAQMASVPDVARPALGTRTARTARTARADIAPLLTCQWNQTAPYNDLCPTQNYKATYTGCAATAMAQMMYYHQWPPKGKGSITYYWDEGGKQLSMDFSATTFDWSSMLPRYIQGEYTRGKATAVATLMKACGYSSQMNYSTSGSGAHLRNCILALRKYFDYSQDTDYAVANTYTLTEWEDLLYDNLVRYGPVQMEGYNEIPAGHSFVTDGYQGDGYFHFNWGWGGQSDGYFRLTALDPDSQGAGGSAGGYTLGQGAVVRARKAMPDDPPYFTTLGNFNYYMSAVSEGQSLGIDGYLVNQGLAPFVGSIVFEAENVANGRRTAIDSVYMAGNNALAVGYGWSGITLDSLGSKLRTGTYRLRTYYQSDGQPRRQQARYCAAQESYVQFGISTDGSVRNATVPLRGGIAVTDWPGSSDPLYKDAYCPLHVAIHSDADQPMWGYIQPTLYTRKSASATPAATLGCIVQTINPGDDTLHLCPEIPSSLSTGTYYLRYEQVVGQIVNGQYTTVPLSDYYPVRVASNPGMPTLGNCTFALADTVNVDPSNITVRYSLQCQSGYFNQPLRLYFFDEGGGTALSYAASPVICVQAGKTVTGQWNGTFDGEPGRRYLAAVFYNNGTAWKQLSGRLYFTLAEKSGLPGIEAENACSISPNPATDAATVTCDTDIADIEVYTLGGAPTGVPTEIDGHRATLSVASLPRGIYLVAVTAGDGSRRTLRLVRR